MGMSKTRLSRQLPLAGMPSLALGVQPTADTGKETDPFDQNIHCFRFIWSKCPGCTRQHVKRDLFHQNASLPRGIDSAYLERGPRTQVEDSYMANRRSLSPPSGKFPADTRNPQSGTDYRGGNSQPWRGRSTSQDRSTPFQSRGQSTPPSYGAAASSTNRNFVPSSDSGYRQDGSRATAAAAQSGGESQNQNYPSFDPHEAQRAEGQQPRTPSAELRELAERQNIAFMARRAESEERKAKAAAVTDSRRRPICRILSTARCYRGRPRCSRRRRTANLSSWTTVPSRQKNRSTGN